MYILSTAWSRKYIFHININIYIHAHPTHLQHRGQLRGIAGDAGERRVCEYTHTIRIIRV